MDIDFSSKHHVFKSESQMKNSQISKCVTRKVYFKQHVMKQLVRWPKTNENSWNLI